MATNIVPNLLLSLLGLTLIVWAVVVLTTKLIGKAFEHHLWIATKEILPLAVYPTVCILVHLWRMIVFASGKYSNEVGLSFMAVVQLSSCALPQFHCHFSCNQKYGKLKSRSQLSPLMQLQLRTTLLHVTSLIVRVALLISALPKRVIRELDLQLIILINQVIAASGLWHLDNIYSEHFSLLFPEVYKERLPLVVRLASVLPPPCMMEPVSV